MVLVEHREHRRNNPLTKGIAERVVDGRGQDAVARGDFAVDGDVQQGAGVLLIGGDIDNAGKRLDLVEEERRPAVELAGVGIGQCVLILGLGHSAANGDVLRGLHIECDTLDSGEPRLKPADHLIRGDVALIAGLERNVHAPVIDRGIAAAGADPCPD